MSIKIDSSDWEPFCGRELVTADLDSVDIVVHRHPDGRPIICTKDHHLTIGSHALKHGNAEANREWW